MTTRHEQRNWLQKLATNLISTKAGGWYMTRIAPHIDRFFMSLSKGRISLLAIGGGEVTALLTTIGAKSGQTRTTPLAFIADNERIVLIASNGGYENHPAWYYNLRANPRAQITILGEAQTYLAREAEGQERDRLWQKAVGFYPGYAKYQERASNRKIPVVVMTPAADK
jgi:deazaflavin-dependent oxidoreductase (nitroreductase family)